jgi:hypothetical protein
MNAAQDWCLQCGRGAPGSLETHAAAWRSGATVLAATAILAIGAAAAAYAALSKGNATPRVVRTTVAQSAPPAATTPAGSAVAPGAAATPPSGLGTPTTVKPLLPGAAVKPPKIPLTTATPKATTTPTLTSGTGTTKSSTTAPATSGGASSGEPKPSAILLDTNAAATYNPYSYPPSDFGDPSLAIDGETATAWTAQVDPAVAPRMAEGLVIDLKSSRRLSALVLVTTTPGMTIQVYGANGQTLPSSITDHAWVKLSHAFVEKAKRLRLKLRESKKAVRFVTLWISRAPASSIGTPLSPGHVSVNQLELFPAG